ncbi:pseudouridylate synthase [Acinetobacter sp. ACNIH3]|jgi:tRNA pseudouridine32 synthase/23S rRNA pseudouridine746 synthase|uniref:pseudouridine synthase n=1 Tax=Acinetobacter TaxID=469 RepID=UPI000CDE24CC|nr:MULTISPECIES: pseudouridine synthase [Acinetobacter]POU26019.1 pseudouridylate synthase [Acinetobacter sp. ACNIH3]POV80147.1 pseudouridylate synthase [Acinetobacter sp. ACNIH4]
MNTSAEFIPPMINGVSASKVFLQPSTATTVYDYLCTQFPHIQTSEWQSRFQEGLVYDAQGNSLNLNSPFQANSHCFYYRFLAHEVHVPFEHQILFENEHFMVIDKPHFLTMSPTGQYVQETLLVRLKKQTGIEHLTPIHRLDRETAGVVLISKNVASRGLYQQLFSTRQVQKTYHAIAGYREELRFPQIVRLRVDKGQPFYTMQVLEGEPNSETEITLLEQKDHLAKYELKPHTGKQHQLRVHLNFLGIPILNDPFYPSVAHKTDNDFSAPLQLLARHIQFIDPITQQLIQFSSEQVLTL